MKKIRFIIFTLFFLAMSILYGVIEIPKLLAPSVDLVEALNKGEIPEAGTFVYVELDGPLGCYMETTHKLNGIIPTGKEQSYAIWLDDKNSSVISLTVKGKKNYQKLDAMVDVFWDWLNDSSEDAPATPPQSKVRYYGSLSTLKGEELSYYNQALTKAGLKNSEYAVVRTIDVDATNGKVSAWLILGFLVLMSVGAAILWIREVKLAS